MRVLHVVDSLEFGGAEKVIVDLANAASQRLDVAICCVRRPGELASQVDPAIPVFCLNAREGNDPAVPLKLRKLVRQRGADVVHLHNWGLFLETALALLWYPVVLLQTVHGPYLQYAPGWRSRVKRFARRWCERLASRRYEVVVGVAASVETYIRNEMKLPVRVITIHNGIGLESGSEPRTGLADGDSVTFISVARLAAVKNQQLMLRAFHRVHGKYGNTRLWLVGDGPERNTLESLVGELGLGDAVVFAGYQEDVADWLYRADIFLLSSHYEGVSISLLEAMRAGLPAIASHVGGIPETLEPGISGLTFESGQEAGMANAMELLIADQPLREKMSWAARQRVRQHFSIDTVVEKYEQLYASLLESR